MAIIMNGKEVADQLYKELKKRKRKLKKNPGLAVVLVGDDPASKIYVENKIKACNKLGIDYKTVGFGAEIEQEFLEDRIIELCADPDYDGVLVQAPLPNHIDSNQIFNLIPKDKDVDGFTDYNAGALLKNESSFTPCTVKGIGYMLDYYNIDVRGKDVCIVGRSNIVGRPLASYLLNKDATVTVCHTKTVDLGSKTRNADILIVAAGCPNLIKADDVKEGAVVIDVGINRTENGLCGDVDFENVKDKCSYITPVPGGVGPMTVAMLMENVIEACEKGWS